ncbi:HD domain-containing protein [Streptomyces niveus]|uniref:HD domain-containing protein n=1 Tax=Streptomyces niveus TaxID=193462 RepID=UPI0036D21298
MVAVVECDDEVGNGFPGDVRGEVGGPRGEQAHPAVQEGAQRIVEEYENGDSLEVICAHDADKLECLIQAVEYREQGYSNVQGWIDSSLQKLKTASAQALAEAALNMTSVEWQRTYLP